MQIITDDYENMISLAYTGGTAPDIIGQSVTFKRIFVDNDMLVPFKTITLMQMRSTRRLTSHMSMHMRA